MIALPAAPEKATPSEKVTTSPEQAAAEDAASAEAAAPAQETTPAKAAVRTKASGQARVVPPATERPEGAAQQVALPATEPKPGAPKPHEHKPDEPTPGERKPGERKPDESKPGEPKPGEPKPDEPKPDEHQPDEPKPDEPKLGDRKPRLVADETGPAAGLAPDQAGKPDGYQAPTSLKLRLTKRGTRLLTALVGLAVLTSVVAVQLRRDPPAAKVAVTVAESVRLPGAALKLPWPKSGSAEMMVEGLGRLGGVSSRKVAPIGSVAKVMTAYQILRHHPLSGDDPGPTITVTAADVEDYQARIPDGQSLVLVKIGEEISEREALEALMLPSANNIAHMLAIWDADTADEFVVGMNTAAEELGMTGTKYTDPSGFLPTTVSTAADQVVLARAALQDPVFADIIAEPSATIPVAGKIENYNDMLGKDGVFGIKTGSTTEAGGNLLFASRLELDGEVLTIVGAVFNQPGEGTPKQLARVNKVVHKLLTAVRAAIHSYSLLPARPIGSITTAWGAAATVSPASVPKVIGWPGLSVPVEITTSAPGASVRPGQTVAAAEARPGPSGVRVELRADRAVSGPSVWWRLTRLS